MTSLIKNRSIGNVPVAELMVILLSASAIIGWIFDIKMLTSIISNNATMKFNTALCFLLIASIPFQFHKKNKKIIVITMSFLVLFISSLTIVQDIFNQNLFIDEIFIKDFWSNDLSLGAPGRMSAATSLCFILLSIAYILLILNTTRLIGQYFLHLVTFLSFVSILSFLFDIPEAKKQLMFASMSIGTSLSFFVLSFKSSLIHSELGISNLFTGKLLGNKMTRLLFPMMLLTNIGLSYIMIKGVNSTSISLEFGIVFYAASFIAISLFILYKSANQVNEIDVQRAREITDRKNAEAWFKTLIEGSPSAMIVANREGNITLINKQTEKLFGYSREELIGHPVTVLVPKTDRKMHPSYIKGFFKEPSSRPMGLRRDLFGVGKDGKKIPIEIGLNPIETEEGLFVMASVIDISTRKKKESIERKNRELEIQQKELEQFNYIASHDLQEPLRTITNYIQILREDFDKDLAEEAHKYLEVVERSAERMGDLIRVILDYSKLEKEKVLTETNVNSLLKEVTSDLESLITSTKTQIIIANNLPTVSAYAVELGQVFQNLISNAIKFRKTGDNSQIEIGCEEEEEFYKFHVKDNGIGMKSEHFQRIFQMLQRLHTRKEYAGYGIGLANCKKIVLMHGGMIWVESSIGIGSTFYFTILKN